MKNLFTFSYLIMVMCDFKSECQICNCIAPHNNDKLCDLHKCKYDYNIDLYIISSKKLCNEPVSKDGYSYCFNHLCQIPTCNNKKSYKYCTKHSCKMEGCLSSKMEDDDVCKSCKSAVRCVIPTCFKKYSGDDRTDDLRWICPDHKCQFPKCIEVQHEKSFFCIDHKCTKPKCGNIATIENGFCSSHKNNDAKVVKKKKKTKAKKSI